MLAMGTKEKIGTFGGYDFHQPLGVIDAIKDTSFAILRSVSAHGDWEASA
jgi:hypothetical protein